MKEMDNVEFFPIDDRFVKNGKRCDMCRRRIASALRVWGESETVVSVGIEITAEGRALNFCCALCRIRFESKTNIPATITVGANL